MKSNRSFIVIVLIALLVPAFVVYRSRYALPERGPERRVQGPARQAVEQQPDIKHNMVQ